MTKALKFVNIEKMKSKETIANASFDGCETKDEVLEELQQKLRELADNGKVEENFGAKLRLTSGKHQGVVPENQKQFFDKVMDLFYEAVRAITPLLNEDESFEIEDFGRLGGVKTKTHVKLSSGDIRAGTLFDDFFFRDFMKSGINTRIYRQAFLPDSDEGGCIKRFAKSIVRRIGGSSQ